MRGGHAPRSRAGGPCTAAARRARRDSPPPRDGSCAAGAAAAARGAGVERRSSSSPASWRRSRAVCARGASSRSSASRSCGLTPPVQQTARGLHAGRAREREPAEHGRDDADARRTSPTSPRPRSCFAPGGRSAARARTRSRARSRTRPCTRRGCPPARGRRRPPARSAPTASRRTRTRRPRTGSPRASASRRAARNGSPMTSIATTSFGAARDRRGEPREPHLEERHQQRVDPDEEAPGRRLVAVAVDERDGQHDLVGDVVEPREDGRAEEEQERAGRRGSTASEPRSGGPSGANAPRCGRKRNATSHAIAGEHRHGREERRPRAEDEQEPAERRPDHDPEVRGDAHRRVRRLVALRRDEVGDHRLRDRAAERAEHAGERQRREPGPLRVDSASRRSGYPTITAWPNRITRRRPIRSDR